MTGDDRPFFTTDIKGRVYIMGYMFVTNGLVDISITAIDSKLIKAKGSVWHKSSMKKGIVPRSLGINTDSRWGIVVQRDGSLNINYI